MKLRINISSQEREDFQGFPDLEKKLNRVINREHRVLPDDQEKQKVWAASLVQLGFTGLKNLTEAENKEIAEAIKELRRKLYGELHSGINLGILMLGIKASTLYAKSGIRAFQQWSKSMIGVLMW